MASLIIDDVDFRKQNQSTGWNETTFDQLKKKIMTSYKLSEADFDKIIEITFGSAYYSGTCDSFKEVKESNNKDCWYDFVYGLCAGGVSDFLQENEKRFSVGSYLDDYDQLFIFNKKGDVIFYGSESSWQLYRLADGEDPARVDDNLTRKFAQAVASGVDPETAMEDEE